VTPAAGHGFAAYQHYLSWRENPRPSNATNTPCPREPSLWIQWRQVDSSGFDLPQDPSFGRDLHIRFLSMTAVQFPEC
jgi:hypothetical protein